MGLWKIFVLYLFNTFKASKPLKAGHKAGNFPRPNFFQKGRFSENRPCTRPAGNVPALCSVYKAGIKCVVTMYSMTPRSVH